MGGGGGGCLWTCDIFYSVARDGLFLKSSLTGFSLLSFGILFPPMDFPLKRNV